MLFFAVFGSPLQPLLIDASSVEHAKSIATDVAQEAPARIKPIPPGVIVVALFAEPEDPGDEVLVMDPLPHVVDYLEELDEELSPSPEAAACGEKALVGEEVVSCSLAPHDEGRHEAITHDGELVGWSGWSEFEVAGQKSATR